MPVPQVRNQEDFVVVVEDVSHSDKDSCEIAKQRENLIFDYNSFVIKCMSSGGNYFLVTNYNQESYYLRSRKSYSIITSVYFFLI